MSHHPTIVAFCPPYTGHLHRMLPVVADLVTAGATVVFYAGREARAEAERTGATFVDLYGNRRELAAVDSTSSPLTSRLVTFAGRFGADIVDEVRALEPGLVLHDTVAVIGRVVAERLGLPRVDVRAGHALDAGRMLKALRADGYPIRTSDACWAAVRTLHERDGILDASPVCGFTDSSASLNVYCEPREFLGHDLNLPPERTAFFGSFWPERIQEASLSTGTFRPCPPDVLRVYVSFGTTMWRVFDRQIREVLGTIVDVLGADTGVQAIVGLGGRDAQEVGAAWRRPNVQVETYVNQNAVLADADVFFTHHGLNSTHEAIYHAVPMVSYPFVWDQPGLATRCQSLGLALPLSTALRGPVTPDDVRRTLAQVRADRSGLQRRLAEARQWEVDVMAHRPVVIRRILDLLGSSAR